MQTLVKKAYEHTDANLRTRFKDVTFTFEEFLWHVVWTHDLGILDPHWTSTYILCHPCRHHYDYVVHLETAAQDVSYLLHLIHHPSRWVLNESPLPFNHRTKANKNSSDFLIYAGLPQNLMNKILQLYWLDFHLFGYSIDTDYEEESVQ